MIKFNLKTNKGFTLLEALVAISILMVAVVAPITIAQKGLSSASYSKNQMIASYLAQDAIEYIKNRRDQNVITNNDWLSGLEKCLPDNKGDPQICKIDTNNNLGAGEIIADDGETLKIQNGLYGFIGEDTNFIRTISMEVQDINGLPDQVMITATVSWGSIENTITVKTLIFNI